MSARSSAPGGDRRHAEGFCKLIVERRQRYLLGAHVLGEYSAEVIQVAAVAMAANLRVEQLAELQLAFPTFTEALGMAAQQLVRSLGVARMPPSPSDLGPAPSTGRTVPPGPDAVNTAAPEAG